MKKSKIKLLYSFFIIIIIICTCFKFANNYNSSKYLITNTNFQIIVTDFKIDGNKLIIEGVGEEKIIVNYYIKTKQEKESIESKLSLGDLLEVRGKLSIPNNNTNLYAFNYRKYLLSKKIKRILKADKIKVLKHNSNIFYKIKNSFINKINKFNNKEYIYLFILGKNMLDMSIKNIYSKNGISHLFAISGMHISLITVVLNKILNIFVKNNKTRFIIIIGSLSFFLFLTDYMPSVIRASLMYIFINIKKGFNLKISNLFILFNIFILLMFLNPYYIYNLGFVFSFVISFSLICSSNVINRFKNYFGKIFITSSISFLTSIPILIYNFHEVNFISVLSNLIFVPYVSLIVFPISLLTFFLPFFNYILKYLIIFLENSSILISKINFLTYTFRHPSIFLTITYIIILFLILKRNKYYIIFLILLLIFHHNLNYFDKNTVLTVIDIGQGDSILLKLPYNKSNILIDTGGKMECSKEKWKKQRNQKSLVDNTIIPYLKAEGINKLDYLILTHGDFDHMGEAINLVNSFKVEKVIFNCGPYNDLEKELIKVLDKKKIKYYSCIRELNIDNNKLHFLQTKEYDNENDNSNVIYTELNGYKFMFMGDAGIEVEEDLIKKYNLQDIDVLKVGHHGSKTSSSIEFINEINPKYSIISVGKNNRYGHTNKEVLESLKESKIYRTDEDGSIMFKIKNSKLKNETCSP